MLRKQMPLIAPREGVSTICEQQPWAVMSLEAPWRRETYARVMWRKQ